MRAFFTKAAVALMVGGALLTAIPAEADARGRGGYSGSRGHGHGGYRGGWSGRGRDYVRHGRHRGYRGGYGYGRHRGHRGYGRYPYFARHRGYGGYYGYGYPAYYGYGYHGGDAALAIGAGLLGVAIGSAIASDRDDHYYEDERYYEDDRYYQYDQPPPQRQVCPDGSPVTPQGYCAAPQQQPPPSYYLPERG
jgi:hypothetical protein